MTIGTQIIFYRKKLGLTQEELAQQLDITNQAVSKWESEQCCPDIMLLPRLADIFGITVDELFGRTASKKAAPEAPAEDSLPWENDDVLRVVLFRGRERVLESEALSRVELVLHGGVNDLKSDFSVTCDEVFGSIEAGGCVTCDDVRGSVYAGGNVTCDDVAGDVTAGGNVTCDDVRGSVSAGRDVNHD